MEQIFILIPRRIKEPNTLNRLEHGCRTITGLDLVEKIGRACDTWELVSVLWQKKTRRLVRSLYFFRPMDGLEITITDMGNKNILGWIPPTGYNFRTNPRELTSCLPLFNSRPAVGQTPWQRFPGLPTTTTTNKSFPCSQASYLTVHFFSGAEFLVSPAWLFSPLHMMSVRSQLEVHDSGSI